jgi:8-oxo-dGTP pyrophosphatase MutT (NUDIX family)
MKITCGIILEKPNGQILICHPTNAPKNSWSIPKGLNEDLEDFFETAKRELLEETSIDLDQLNYSITEISQLFIYKNKRKCLKAFWVHLNDNKIDQVKLECKSLVDDEYPEVDKFIWTSPNEALKMLHQTQIEAVQTGMSELSEYQTIKEN